MITLLKRMFGIRPPAVPLLPPLPPPTTEHVTTSHNAVTLRADLPTSFVTVGVGADGPQVTEIGPGPSDGFDKTVFYSGGPAGCTLRVFARGIAGSLCTLPDVGGGGAVTVTWISLAQTWAVKSTYLGVVGAPPTLPLS